MGLFDFLTQRNKNTASVAKNRLQILIQQERSLRNAPDYLPLLQRELLEVIRKYIAVDADAVTVDLHKDGDNDLLEGLAGGGLIAGQAHHGSRLPGSARFPISCHVMNADDADERG
jgi:cell division topological specificity factor